MPLPLSSSSPTLPKMCHGIVSVKKDKPTTAIEPRYLLVEATGIEPATFWMQIRCSPNWAMPPIMAFRLKNMRYEKSFVNKKT